MLITVMLVDDAWQNFVTPWSAFTIPACFISNLGWRRLLICHLVRVNAARLLKLLRTPFYFIYVQRQCIQINECLFRTIMITNRPLHRANQDISEYPEMRYSDHAVMLSLPSTVISTACYR